MTARMVSTRSRSAMPAWTRCCRAAWRRPPCMKCLPPVIRVLPPRVSSQGLAGRVTARRPLVWVRQDFSEIESGALSMSGLAELGLDPRYLVTVRAADIEQALAHVSRCAGLRCSRRRRAGGLGREQAARSRRLPQADAGRPSLRCHLSRAARRGHAVTLNRRDKMDRARGAFAVCADRDRMGGAQVRR